MIKFPNTPTFQVNRPIYSYRALTLAKIAIQNEMNVISIYLSKCHNYLHIIKDHRA